MQLLVAAGSRNQVAVVAAVAVVGSRVVVDWGQAVAEAEETVVAGRFGAEEVD